METDRTNKEEARRVYVVYLIIGGIEIMIVQASMGDGLKKVETFINQLSLNTDHLNYPLQLLADPPIIYPFSRILPSEIARACVRPLPMY